MSSQPCASSSSAPGPANKSTSPTTALSPRTFEQRLRQVGPAIPQIARAAEVSPKWSRFVEQHGWNAVSWYLWNQPLCQHELHQRYYASMRQLLAQDLLLREWRRVSVPNAAPTA